MYPVFRSARQISLVSSRVLHVSAGGSIPPGFIQGGDVDNDGSSELVVATTEGTLLVYKHIDTGEPDDLSPAYTFHGLQTIACFCIGQACKSGENCVVVVCKEGKCFLLEAEVGGSLGVIQSFDVIWNVTCCLLSDLDEDGVEEVVLSSARVNGDKVHTDVVVHKVCEGELLETFRWSLEGDVVSMSVCDVPCVDGKNLRCILVGLSIGGYATLAPNGSILRHALASSDTPHTDPDTNVDDLEGYSPGSNSNYLSYVLMRSPTLVLGNIKHLEQPNKGGTGTQSRSAMVALCSLGGILQLEEMQSLEGEEFKIAHSSLWQEPMSTQLFAVNSVAITGNETEEIVSCSWDGLTCIYDCYNNVVRFTFPERVQCFWAGVVSTRPNEDKVIFAYATFGNSITVYTDVQAAIPRVGFSSLIDVLRSRKKLKDVLACLDSAAEPERKDALVKVVEHLEDSEKQMVYISNLLHHALHDQHD